MSDTPGRQWRFYCADMETFAKAVLEYTDGMDQTAFIADRRTFDATIRNLELIGEAASRIPEHVRLSHPAVPWRLLIATRNRLIHGYLGIDPDTIWSIIKVNVPELIDLLQLIRDADWSFAARGPLGRLTQPQNTPNQSLDSDSRWRAASRLPLAGTRLETLPSP